jgi:membrane protease YdiL (CAAX protease family)
MDPPLNDSRDPELQPAAQRPPRTAGRLADAAPWLLTGAACALLGSAFLTLRPGEPATQLWASIATQALFACTALGIARLAGPARLPEGLRLGPSRLGLGALATLVVGFVAVSHGLSLMIAWLELRDTGALREIDRLVESARRTPPGLGLVLLGLGIAPAIGEELLCRGLVQQGVRSRLGPILAVVLSALFFGLLHYDRVQGPAAVVLGLYLGSTTEIAGSVRAAALCHAANNILGVLVPELTLPMAWAPVPFWAAGIGTFGFALLAWVGLRASPAGTAPPRFRGDRNPPTREVEQRGCEDRDGRGSDRPSGG